MLCQFIVDANWFIQKDKCFDTSVRCWWKASRTIFKGLFNIFAFLPTVWQKHTWKWLQIISFYRPNVIEYILCIFNIVRKIFVTFCWDINIFIWSCDICVVVYNHVGSFVIKCDWL